MSKQGQTMNSQIWKKNTHTHKRLLGKLWEADENILVEPGCINNRKKKKLLVTE